MYTAHKGLRVLHHVHCTLLLSTKEMYVTLGHALARRVAALRPEKAPKTHPPAHLLLRHDLMIIDYCWLVCSWFTICCAFAFAFA